MQARAAMRLVSGALLTRLARHRLARHRLALPRLFCGVVRDGIWGRITESATPVIKPAPTRTGFCVVRLWANRSDGEEIILGSRFRWILSYRQLAAA